MRLTYRAVVRKRTAILFYAFLLAYGWIAFRLTDVQYFNAEAYELFGKTIRDLRRTLPAQRGVIYDRVGRELAISVRAASIYAHPRRIGDADEVSARLASALGCDRERLAEKLTRDVGFVWLQRGADDRVGEKLTQARIKGIGVIREQKRVYPSGRLAAHVVGFTNIDNQGLEGIERAVDRELRGSDGFLVAEVDPDGRVIPETRRKAVRPHDGKDVALTIDAYIQHVAEAALDETYKATKCRSASVVVMDPKTGEVVALANMPSFNPNDRSKTKPDSWRNRAVIDLYEPGSTLKAVTVAAALEEGIITPTTVFANCAGSVRIGRRSVRCVLHGKEFAHGHGQVDLRKMICYSCNIGASQLGLRLGAERLYKYAKTFGLLSAPRIGLDCETTGKLDSPVEWSQIKMANVAFGQGISVTPLQLACAYGAIANGGVMMRPTIVKEIRNQDGSPYRLWAPAVLRRVVSRKTAREVTKVLVACVRDGTGKNAAVEGYTVAGKTGSAQKAREDGLGYAPGKFVASFVGFLPASNPRLVILVVVDEPQGTHWGSAAAAPAFKEIARKTMWYLQVPRDVPASEPGTRVARRFDSA